VGMVQFLHHPLTAATCAGDPNLYDAFFFMAYRNSLINVTLILSVDFVCYNAGTTKPKMLKREI